MGKGASLSFALAVAIFFGFGKVALSFAQQSHHVNPSDLQALDIRIPSASGYVIETHQPDVVEVQSPFLELRPCSLHYAGIRGWKRTRTNRYP